MSCEDCIKDITTSLYNLQGTEITRDPGEKKVKLTSAPGINKVDARLKDQLVFIEGTAPPSSIVSAIQATGRDAILRGSGSSNGTSGPR